MVKNEDGLVKCLTKKGNIRWIIEKDAIDSILMKSMELVVAPSPIKLEPKIIIEEQVAEAVVADKPRKTKTK